MTTKHLKWFLRNCNKLSLTLRQDFYPDNFLPWPSNPIPFSSHAANDAYLWHSHQHRVKNI